VFLSAPFEPIPASVRRRTDRDNRKEDQTLFAGMLERLMARHRTAGWDGFVFDLSGAPLEKTVSVLSVLGSPLDSPDAKPDARP